MRPFIRIFVALLLLQPGVAGAADPPRSVGQYTHQRWSAESDAPRPIVALAQDRRGYLWVAAADGLYRFDGLRFEPIGRGVDLIANGSPSALLVRRNGEVWTNFERSRKFAVYRGGRLMFLRAPPAPGRVMAMHEAADGTIWVLTEAIGQPLLRWRNGRWTAFGAAAGAPLDNPFSMVVTRDGSVWLSFAASVARLTRDGTRLETMRRTPGALGRLALDPEQRVWLVERHGAYPITGPGGAGAPPPLRHAYATDPAQIRGRPAFDRDGNLWIATYYGGLERVSRPDPRGAASPAEAIARVEHFTARDGLTSDATTQISQDAEGNVWVATEGGLDRFWPATVRSEPALADPAAFGDLLLAASDGSVYIGEARTVYRVRPGGRPEPIFHSRVEPRTLCEAPDGAIWIGAGRQVTIWRNGQPRPLGKPAPVTDTIYDCAFGTNGDYWVTAALGGMARYRAGHWDTPFGPANAGFRPSSMLRDARGALVVQWNERLLARIEGRARRSAAIPFGSYEPEVTALYSPAADTLFAAGRFGLTRLRGGSFRTLYASRVPLLSDAKGMVRTPDGAFWIAAPAGLLRLPSAALDRAFADPAAVPPITVFGAADGLRSRPHSHSRHAIVRGGDGRLWIATQSGTQWLDPDDIARSPLPPQLAISALTANRIYRDPADLVLPAGTSNLQIDFAVLGFSNPRQSVRYRLEGFDPAWRDPGTRRQAFYTNLAPGSYRFQVIARSGAGVWNRTGASVAFEIPPSFVQSRWFLALCAAAALLLLWLLYRLRVAQVAARIRARLEERLRERERIARELHDTLLQSVQGLVLRFQSVANRMPEDGPRTQLEAALARADQVLAEGRDRVQGLRSAECSGDLPELLKERAIGAGFGPEAAIRIVVEGKPRPVDPLVAVELGRIVGEALFNVARHAQARMVDITIRFAARQLAVEVRDDGVGIAAELLETGHKPGHFGLIGMRERAERIGGSFSIESSPGMGCTVTITLPARIAFAGQTPRRRRLFRLLRRGKEVRRA